MKRTIILHGHLHDKLPRNIVVGASTVAEALKYLQLQPELIPPDGKPWPVTVEGVNTELALSGPTDMEEIHVYPRLAGGGGDTGGYLQIIVGVILIIVGIITFEIGGGVLIAAGAGMVLGGIVQLLTPVPEIDTSEGVASSDVIGATKNTVKIGTTIPIIYGTRKWAGHYISFNVDASNSKDVSPLGVIADKESTIKSTFTEQDVVIAMVKADYPLLPIFSSPTPGLGNVPTDGFQP